VRRLSAFGRFWYDFVIGDDWTVAAGVAIALLVTYVLAHGGMTSAWFVLPAMVAAGLSASLWRATGRRSPPA
jgi:hypothetical protein